MIGKGASINYGRGGEGNKNLAILAAPLIHIQYQEFGDPPHNRVLEFSDPLPHGFVSPHPSRN